MDERIFWETMNPARLHALYDARFEPREDPPAQEQHRSLSEYLAAGGE